MTSLTLMVTLDSSDSQSLSSIPHNDHSDNLESYSDGWSMELVHDNIDTLAGEHEM